MPPENNTGTTILATLQHFNHVIAIFWRLGTDIATISKCESVTLVVCLGIGSLSNEHQSGILYHASLLIEGIRQCDSCNTGELDRHAQHQQPCPASRTPRVVVRQEQPVLSGTHCSSFARRQMSVVFCLQRLPMKLENCHIRHQRPPQGHQRPPR